jgi:16S rRNA (guanine(966)-N(2))-methyltransferase RsmD
MAKKIQKCYKTKVIAGKYRGKNIEIPALSTTRSSKAVLRESLFNTLQFEIMDKAFVEVFAGSGSVAIEAVSRGASVAWCIEKNRDVYKILEKNIRNITKGEINPIFGDSFEMFYTVLSELKFTKERAYFYFDPPFSIREGMEDIYQKVLDLIADIDRDLAIMVIVEHMSSIDLPESIGEFELLKKRKFGKSSLSYFIPKEVEDE